MNNAECPKCDASPTRRISRRKTLKARLMYFLGYYPWECLVCQKHFYSSQRSSGATRSAAGEVYTGSTPTPKVQPNAKEDRPR